MTDLPDLTDITIVAEPTVPVPISRAARKQRAYRQRKRAKLANAMVAICTARNRNGYPCRKVGTGNPPLCSWHGGRVGSVYNRLLLADEWTKHIKGAEREREEQARIARIAALPQGTAYLTRKQKRDVAEAAARDARARSDASSDAAVEKEWAERIHQAETFVAELQKPLEVAQAHLAEVRAAVEAERTERQLWRMGTHPDQLREQFGTK